MSMKNTANSYGTLTKVFHWLLFLMIVGAMTGGVLESGMEDGPEKDELVGMHISFGITIFMLVVARLAWRFTNVQPGPADGVTEAQHAKAHKLHIALYVLMLAQPLAGILMVQAAGYTAGWFGVFDLPTLVSASDSARDFFHECHEVIWILLALLALGHTVLAFVHHFVHKNNVLRRMTTG